VGFEKLPELEQLLAEVENFLKQAPPEASVRTLRGKDGQFQTFKTAVVEETNRGADMATVHLLST
jgi:hypothetical protein